jgi:hypothetical protein
MKKIKIKNPFKNTMAITSLIIVSTFLINFVVLINNAEPYVEPFSNSTNQTVRRPTRTFTCYEPNSFFKIWDVYHMLMYSLIPFIVIFVQNFAISYLTYRHTHRIKKYGENEGDGKSKVPVLSDYPATNTTHSAVVTSSSPRTVIKKKS